MQLVLICQSNLKSFLSGESRAVLSTNLVKLDRLFENVTGSRRSQISMGANCLKPLESLGSVVPSECNRYHISWKIHMVYLVNSVATELRDS